MDRPSARFSPEAMTFTDLLDEYLTDRQRSVDLSEEARQRLARIKYELNVRCAPKDQCDR